MREAAEHPHRDASYIAELKSETNELKDAMLTTYTDYEGLLARDEHIPHELSKTVYLLHSTFSFRHARGKDSLERAFDRMIQFID